jgi:tetratricopeptide (TPR) repeat protein
MEWTKDQLPRVLLGIGDCLSALQRHADAADAYSRAQQLRQTQLDAIIAIKEDTIEHLQCQRRVCEATVLIAEELLACPDGQDVVTTETKSLIVEADQRIEYSRGYYDKARDSLQDTVYLMGKLAAKKVDLGTEKEDVCYLATMIMGVGEQLAALDEEIAEQKAAASTEPAKKKAKT